MSSQSEEPSELERLIFELESRWEDPYVDFKRQLSLKTQGIKGEFVKDILGLANTQGPSRRFLMVGWDDKTQQVFAPGVDRSINADRLQQVINAYCEPPPHIEYSTCLWGGVPVGVIEIKREAGKIPYRVRKTIGSLRAGQVFVRHGTITEPPTTSESEGLHQEALNARLREAADPLIRPDQATLRFAPQGLLTGALMSPEAAVRHHARTISIPLADSVPDHTRKLFERLQTLHMHGIWSPDFGNVGGSGYQMFTLADDYALQVLEHAFAARLLAYYEHRVEIVDSSGHSHAVDAPQFSDLLNAIEGRRWRISSRKHPGKSWRFRGRLDDMFAWARAEGLLRGQRSRRFDFAFPRMLARTRPLEFRLGSPPDSSLTIREVGEFINCIWGSATPDGQVFPTPSERIVRAIGWNPKSQTIQVFRPEDFSTQDPAPEWELVVVLCVDEDEVLRRFHSDFAVTNCPADYLVGPSSWAETAEWFATHSPPVDSIDCLDQYFVVPIGRREWARTPNQLAGLPRYSRSGNWLLIQADSPWDAYHHARESEVLPKEHPLLGRCDKCWVDGRLAGGWQQVMKGLEGLGLAWFRSRRAG